MLNCYRRAITEEIGRLQMEVLYPFAPSSKNLAMRSVGSIKPAEFKARYTLRSEVKEIRINDAILTRMNQLEGNEQDLRGIYVTKKGKKDHILMRCDRTALGRYYASNAS